MNDAVQRRFSSYTSFIYPPLQARAQAMPSKGTRCWGCRQFTRAANLAHTYCCYHWMMSAAFSSRPTESTGKKNGDTGTVLTGDSRQGTQTSNERKKRRRRQTQGPALRPLRTFRWRYHRRIITSSHKSYCERKSLPLRLRGMASR